MEITLLGTGDTTGTPTVGCQCETCERAKTNGVERSRFSVHIHNPLTESSLLIDVSPDFRHQFLENDVGLPEAAIITHIHFDHLDGLGNAFRILRELDVFGSDQIDNTTGESVAATICERYAYLDAVTVHPIEPYETETVCGLEYRLLPVHHPPFDSYGLVIRDPETGGRLGITGDTSYAIPARTRAELEGVDLLLADALVNAEFCEGHPAGGRDHNEDGIPMTFGTKHMTREGALSLAEELGVGDVRLVHASHFYSASDAFVEPLAVDGERYEI